MFSICGLIVVLYVLFSVMNMRDDVETVKYRNSKNKEN